MRVSIPLKQLEKWRDEITPYMFWSSDDDEGNNDGVITVLEEIDSLIRSLSNTQS